MKKLKVSRLIKLTAAIRTAAKLQLDLFINVKRHRPPDAQMPVLASGSLLPTQLLRAKIHRSRRVSWKH
jgi:hypothetical protein